MDYESIRKELEDAISAIGAKHGFTSSLGTITYSPTGFHATINGKVNDIGNGKSGAQLEYEMLAGKFNIDPTSFGKTFTVKNQTFRIIGINSRARTLPIIAEEVSTGAKYKFSVTGAYAYDVSRIPVNTINFGKGK